MLPGIITFPKVIYDDHMGLCAYNWIEPSSAWIILYPLSGSLCLRHYATLTFGSARGWLSTSDSRELTIHVDWIWDSNEAVHKVGTLPQSTGRYGSSPWFQRLETGYLVPGSTWDQHLWVDLEITCTMYSLLLTYRYQVVHTYRRWIVRLLFLAPGT